MKNNNGNAGIRLILASASPRRAELIQKVISEFDSMTVRIIPSDIAEIVLPDESPEEYAVRIAAEKAQAVYSSVFNKQSALDSPQAALVLGCDTVVALNGKIYGKPADSAEAETMFRELCGNTHEVITGVCLMGKGKIVKEFEKSFVSFGAFFGEIVYTYIASGACFDKAGGYGLQDPALKSLITNVEGDPLNVIGLPVQLITRILRESFVYGNSGNRH